MILSDSFDAAFRAQRFERNNRQNIERQCTEGVYTSQTVWTHIFCLSPHYTRPILTGLLLGHPRHIANCQQHTTDVAISTAREDYKPKSPHYWLVPLCGPEAKGLPFRHSSGAHQSRCWMAPISRVSFRKLKVRPIS